MAEQGDSFRAAVQKLAEKMYRRLDGHPDVDTLLAYGAREVTDEEAEQLRDHLAVCPDCCGLLLDAEIFRQEGPESEELQPAELEAAWQQVQVRIRESGRASLPIGPGRWSRYRLAAAMAASFFVASISLSYHWGHLSGTQARQPASVTLVDLVPEEMATRGEPVPARMPAGTGPVVLVPCFAEPGLPGSSDKLVLKDGPRVKWVSSGLKPDADGCFALVVERDWLPASGPLRLELYAQRSGHERRIASYQAEIEPDE